MSNVILPLVLMACCYCVSFGLVRLVIWQLRQMDMDAEADFRVYCMVEEARRTLGKKRADERDWERAA